MARNLQKGGVKLFVYNRTKDKAKELVRNGAEFCESPSKVGEKCETIVTMLSEPDVVRKIALDEESGFMSTLKKHKNPLWIDCSTVDPQFSKEMQLVCEKCKVEYADSPAAGSIKPAEDGTLVFLVGCKEDVFGRVKSVMGMMGKKIVRVGNCGKAVGLKMLVNSLLAINMTAYSECLGIGKKLGIKDEILFDNLPSFAVVAPFVKYKAKKIKENDFSTEFPLKWMHKDLVLASLTARETNSYAPLINQTKELYQLSKSKERNSEEDFSSISKVFQ